MKSPISRIAMVIRAVVVVVPVVVIIAIVGLVVIIVIVGVVVVVVFVVRCCGSCSGNYSTNHDNIIGITRKRVFNDNTNTDGCCFKCQRKTFIFLARSSVHSPKTSPNTFPISHTDDMKT